ncbi:hypothetical protein CCU68_07175 [Pseudomonas gingeri NCPPB 3146 = LMG 5327]|uniref:Uncharacterized protein n=2 Tax=Pseudomonas gingeri TaxID=117681 RepID=A0A7Y8CEH3_9PSED|nr:MULTISPECIES: hypothetical protein [Pseudomonas]NVZ26982.1 hypothetical protein [Pseudomonas gingeri]NWC15869.1 hypothetical protein [Pseudomonas gingeri]PNQ93330.1 hypothetical protein CCU68_07175 [Pseudomonas gingeri NCPPB 3146 = LMG 5327]BBP75373.1 hypothetical protein PHLH7_14770 [Pseudomonas sp. Ost2]
MGISIPGSSFASLPSLAAKPLTPADVPGQSVTIAHVAPTAAEEAETQARIKANVDTRLAQLNTHSEAFLQAQEQLGAATIGLRSVFNDFKSSLGENLAGKSFGFTVGADGLLRVLDTHGSLSHEEMEQLNGLMNNSSSLKNAAHHYMSSAIDYVNEDQKGPRMLGATYFLDKANFGGIIDLGAVAADPRSRGAKDGWLTSQLWNKGIRTGGIHEVV